MIEEQFDREKRGSGAIVFDDLLPEERTEVVHAIQTLLDHAGSGGAKAVRVFLGFMHKTYQEPCMESRLGQDPVLAHIQTETALARCGAALEIMELLTDTDVMVSVLENLTQE